MESNYDIEFYKNFSRFVKHFMKIFYNIECSGIENIPEDTNYILAGNHLHILDSWLLMSLVDDPLRFMVDKKLYRYALWEKFFTKLGTFPIDPESFDLKAIKTTLELLKTEENIVIFPEGATHSRKSNLPFKPGITKISSKTNTPIVPFGINGTYVPFTTLKIAIGSPINFKISSIPKNEQDAYLENEVRRLEYRLH